MKIDATWRLKNKIACSANIGLRPCAGGLQPRDNTGTGYKGTEIARVSGSTAVGSDAANMGTRL
eukprot:1958837-Pyramimonas_sp.AAC.1